MQFCHVCALVSAAWVRECVFRLGFSFFSCQKKNCIVISTASRTRFPLVEALVTSRVLYSCEEWPNAGLGCQRVPRPLEYDRPYVTRIQKKHHLNLLYFKNIQFNTINLNRKTKKTRFISTVRVGKKKTIDEMTWGINAAIRKQNRIGKPIYGCV